MAKQATMPEPNLPWLDDREDRTFRRIVWVLLVVFIAGGVGSFQPRRLRFA